MLDRGKVTLWAIITWGQQDPFKFVCIVCGTVGWVWWWAGVQLANTLSLYTYIFTQLLLCLILTENNSVLSVKVSDIETIHTLF